MGGTIKFDYYYGIEAEQFSFYRVPRLLIKDERFKGLSSDAKLLYGLMLDRMSLSMKNGWLDDENRAYIIYTVDAIMEDLGCGKDKAIKVLAELDTNKGIGLVERIRRGLGKPDIIYVMIDGSVGRSGVSTSIECDAHFLTSIRSQIERLRLSHRRKCFVSRVFPNAYWRPIGAVFCQNGNRKGAAYAVSIGRSCSARRGGRNGQIKRQKQIVATFLIHDDLRTDKRILLRTGRRRIGS